jgi:hypothetical protein
MNRIAFVLLPVAVLALVALVFHRVSRREAADPKSGTATTRSASDSAASSEVARLRAEIESLRQENEKQRQRAAAAELKLAEASAASTETTPAEKKKPVKREDWKSRRDAELEAKIKSMAWRKNVNGLIDYWKELEKARVEGRAPRMDPEMIARLTQLSKDATELHKFLGIEGANIYDSFNNDLVHEAWMDAFFQELTGGSVTDAQLARLRGTKLYENQDDQDWENANRLEGWIHLMQHNQTYGTDTQGVLTPEQYAQVSKAVTPTFMLSVYASYSERTVGSAAAVTDFWIDSFKLDAVAQRAAVEAVAGDFTTRLKELTQGYASHYGATLPRDAEFELRIKSLELQAAAEKRLIESLHLDPEQAKTLLKGSGSALLLGN